MTAIATLAEETADEFLSGGYVTRSVPRSYCQQGHSHDIYELTYYDHHNHHP